MIRGAWMGVYGVVKSIHIVLSLQEGHMKRVTESVFRVCLLFLNIIHLKFIHVILYISNSVLID